MQSLIKSLHISYTRLLEGKFIFEAGFPKKSAKMNIIFQNPNKKTKPVDISFISNYNRIHETV